MKKMCIFSHFLHKKTCDFITLQSNWFFNERVCNVKSLESCCCLYLQKIAECNTFLCKTCLTV